MTASLRADPTGPAEAEREEVRMRTGTAAVELGVLLAALLACGNHHDSAKPAKPRASVTARAQQASAPPPTARPQAGDKDAAAFFNWVTTARPDTLPHECFSKGDPDFGKCEANVAINKRTLYYVDWCNGDTGAVLYQYPMDARYDITCGSLGAREIRRWHVASGQKFLCGVKPGVELLIVNSDGILKTTKLLFFTTKFLKCDAAFARVVRREGL